MGKVSLKNSAIILCLMIVSLMVLPMLYSIQNTWYQAILMLLGLMVMVLAYLNLKDLGSTNIPKKHLSLSVVFAVIVIASLFEFELSALAFAIPDVVIRNTSLALIFVSALLIMPLTAKKLNY
jgi:hypothetical protein